MADRIKGQEVGITISVGGELEAAAYTAIQNMNWSAMGVIISKGYLGEKTERKDSIFNGIKGDLEFHHDNPAWLRVWMRILDFQQRRDPSLVVNVTVNYYYPSGETANVLIPDVKFGEQPSSQPNRADYASGKLNFESEKAIITFS